MKAKLILQYYVLSGLFSMCGLSIISAIYVTFLIKNGLNLFQVNLVNTAFFLTLEKVETKLQKYREQEEDKRHQMTPEEVDNAVKILNEKWEENKRKSKEG